MRVLMLGTPRFAVPTLEALIASRHDVVGLMSQPDRPKGRGQKLMATPTKAVAAVHGIPVFQPTKLRDEALAASLRALRPDIGVVAAYGRIIPDALLTLPRLGMLNVHGSLLPKYRGAAPVQRAVLDGEAVTGVTIMRVVSELDAGPMLATTEVPITNDATSEELAIVLARLGAELMVRVLDRIDAGETIEEVPQPHELATYAPKIEKADGLIDWSRPASAIHNQVRGLHPWPHAYTYLGSDRLLIHRSAVTEGRAAPGTLRAGERLLVGTGEGLLEILSLQPEGRRVMQAREWTTGRRDLQDHARFTAAP